MGPRDAREPALPQCLLSRPGGCPGCSSARSSRHQPHLRGHAAQGWGAGGSLRAPGGSGTLLPGALQPSAVPAAVGKMAVPGCWTASPEQWCTLQTPSSGLRRVPPRGQLSSPGSGAFLVPLAAPRQLLVSPAGRQLRSQERVLSVAPGGRGFTFSCVTISQPHAPMRPPPTLQEQPGCDPRDRVTTHPRVQACLTVPCGLLVHVPSTPVLTAATCV